MSADVRGWRVALVPDVLVNPAAATPPAAARVLPILAECGYGVLQMPPPGQHALLLSVIADQVAEYAHHGYAVIAIAIEGARPDPLHWRRLAPLLRHRGVALPPRLSLRPAAPPEQDEQRLRAFLADYDIPETERQRWRG